MCEDMQLRNLSPETQRAYVHYVSGLARFYQTSPEHLCLEEIREYQLYLINVRRYSPESVNSFVAAAKFLYNVTLETPWPERALPRARIPKKLPVVLSTIETRSSFSVLMHDPLPCGADDGVWRGAACLRGGGITRWRHRFQSHVDPDTAEQRQQKVTASGATRRRCLRCSRCWWRSRCCRPDEGPPLKSWLFPGFARGSSHGCPVGARTLPPEQRSRLAGIGSVLHAVLLVDTAVLLAWRWRRGRRFALFRTLLAPVGR